MNAKQLNKLLSLHRSFGTVLGILVLLWALTGVLHPIMSATQPQPVKRMPPSQQLDLHTAIPANQVLQLQNIQQFSALQTIQLTPEQVAYRILKPKQNIAEYYDSRTGQIIKNAEQFNVIRLANWYTGLSKQQVVSAQIITSFSDDYPSVNRLLPVWRVNYYNGLRAYVDPSQSRLATLSNDQKMWMAKIFRLGHTWTWGDQPWKGQSLIMQLALIGILCLVFMGFGLFFKIHNRKNHRLRQKPIRFLHRYLAVSLSTFILLWVISGFYHIWNKKPKIPVFNPIFHAQDLSPDAWKRATQHPVQGLSIVPIAFSTDRSHAAWLILSADKPQMQGSMTSANEHDHHHHSKDTAPAIQMIDAYSSEDLDVLEQSKILATNYFNLSIHQLKQATWITSFGGEYGFINKRLPVVKVETSLSNQLRVYIEPSSGVIAAQVTQQDALEGFSFAYLHKWTWLPIDKTLRDILLATIAGFIALLVILGFFIRAKR